MKLSDNVSKVYFQCNKCHGIIDTDKEMAIQMVRATSDNSSINQFFHQRCFDKEECKPK